MAAAGGAARLAFRVMVGTRLAAVVLAIALDAVATDFAITTRTITRVFVHFQLHVVRSLSSDRRAAYKQ